MSHHILHIFTHGSLLRKQRGRLVCVNPDGDENSLAIEDIRAVVVAARGISMTQDLTSALMASNAIILHCDDSYRPVGITSGVERVVRSGIIRTQANPSLKLHDRIWSRIVAAKVANQASILESLGANTAFIRRSIERRDIDEAACARYYWTAFFGAITGEPIRRRQDDPGGLNARLNYGYAVLGALVHRSIIIHGLSPLFGIHHIPRYQAHAFVYDLIEPWRPYVDRMLLVFSAGDDDGSMTSWARTVSQTLKDDKLLCCGRRLKLFDALDVYTSAIARCYEERTVKHVWMPELKP